MKEQQVAHWETYHQLPGCREMGEHLDKQPEEANWNGQRLTQKLEPTESFVDASFVAERELDLVQSILVLQRL
ncbi:MAG: hypothetical protein V1837_01905 [Candidatus Woesearchaeota archaeon]